jgi:hypothetical protein
MTPPGDAATQALSSEDRLWSALHQPRPRTRGGLPVAALSSTRRDNNMFYAITMLDARGRLADASPLRMLGWQPGLALEVGVSSGVVVVAPDPSAAVKVTSAGHLRLPAPIRHACDLQPGDRVLVAACPVIGRLLVYPMRVLDTMVMTHATSIQAHR